VNIYYSSKFELEYRRLSIEIKHKAELKEKIFRNNPHDPRLKTHALQNMLRGYWSFSVNRQIRIIFEFVNEDEVWFHSVGNHDIYKQF
jgi:mRNA-degrading endonuclease YafQ of YafQ-DinJ toxin-antitoxin module